MERRSGGEKEVAWRAGFQRKYIRQLVAMLRRGRIERATSGLTQSRSRAVKLAADLSLAMTARGRTAWSRAILRKYLSRLHKSGCQRLSVVKSRVNSPRSASTKNSWPCKMTYPGNKSIRRLFGAVSRSRTSIRSETGTVASRMQTLRELIPGSRLLDTPVFLEEVTDYIMALKMQVQAMQALTGWYRN